ncbi:sugar transferase [Planctomycetota bacterium]
MNLICIHRDASNNIDGGLLRFAMTSEPIAGLVLDSLSTCLSPEDIGSSVPEHLEKLDIGKTVFAVPKEWKIDPRAWQEVNGAERHVSDTRPERIYYGDNILVPFEHENSSQRDEIRKSWFILSNGRFATKIDIALLERIIYRLRADVVVVYADPKLLGEREEVRLTAEGKVAAFHRVYTDSAEYAFVAADWPHHLFIKTNVLERILPGGVLPLSFSTLLNKCRSEELMFPAVNVAGAVLDLESEEGLLSFCGTGLSRRQTFKFKTGESQTVSGNPRCIGDVVLGGGVNIASDVVLVGPTIISDKVKIEPGAIISSSIVGPGVCIPKGEYVQNCVVRGPQYERRSPTQYRSRSLQQISNLSRDFNYSQDSCRSFRKWKRFSYARCLKRITDCLVAILVLLLFAPLIPFIALAIKLTSPGPVFYKDRRQGLHGKDFNCLKFRTMITGAHEIQEKLRIVSQVDGPQFKMEDDPRISTVGRFLRETYIDEIPQFINVLTGQMGVVGPRPSPKSENTLCPLWRDARLSVRPGITGLWQVHRTRQPMKDFQEWIHYDIEYVRNLSLKMDLSICWQTTRKLLDNFISQF